MGNEATKARRLVTANKQGRWEVIPVEKMLKVEPFRK